MLWSRQKWGTPGLGYPDVAVAASGEPFLRWQLGDRKQQAGSSPPASVAAQGPGGREPCLVEAGLECS